MEESHSSWNVIGTFYMIHHSKLGWWIFFSFFSKKVWGGYLKKWPFFSIYYERFIPVSKSGNKTPLDIPIASAPWKFHTTSRRYHVRATVAGVKGRGQAQSDEDMGKQWYPARLGHTPRGGLPTRMGWVLRCLWSSVTRGLEVDLFLIYLEGGACHGLHAASAACLLSEIENSKEVVSLLQWP